MLTLITNYCVYCSYKHNLVLHNNETVCKACLNEGDAIQHGS